MNDQPQPQLAPAIDPDCIPEMLCDGQFNVFPHGEFVTLTFTHVRPEAAGLLSAEGTSDLKAIVRARIVITTANLVALRDLVNRIIQTPGTTMPPAGGTKH
jgi:hypothetical protein